MAGPFVAQASREQRRLGVLTGAWHTAAAATTREQQDGDEFGREQHEPSLPDDTRDRARAVLRRPLREAAA